MRAAAKDEGNRRAIVAVKPNIALPRGEGVPPMANLKTQKLRYLPDTRCRAAV